MAAQPAAQAPNLGQLSASGALGDVGHNNVSSGGHAGGGSGQRGMGSGVTGNENIGEFLSQGGNLDGIAKAGGIDNLMSGIGGSMEHNIFDAFDQGNMSPFGVSHEGLNLSNELTKASLSNATSTVEMTGFKIAGNTGVLSGGQGQGH